MALHHRDRAVRPLPNGFEADLSDFGGQRIGADDENRRAGLQLFLQQAGGALGAGHNVVGLGRETHGAQVLCDFGGPAGGVVRDVERARVD